MEVYGFCREVHKGKFRRIVKKKAREKKRAEAKMIGKRSNGEGGVGTGEKNSGRS